MVKDRNSGAGSHLLLRGIFPTQDLVPLGSVVGCSLGTILARDGCGGGCILAEGAGEGELGTSGCRRCSVAGL